MANVIDWYVVELKLLLNGKLPSSRVDEIVKETDGHLRESVQRKISPAVDETHAAAAAIEAYGPPEKVAMGFLKGSRQKLWGLNPGWWAAFGAITTIFCWNFHWLTLGGFFDHFGETWKNVLAGFVGVLGLVLVVIAVRAGLRSFRLALTVTTIATAVLSIPLMSYWMIPTPSGYQGISRFHLDQDLPKLEQSLGHIETYEALIQRGLREYAAAKSPEELSEDLRNPGLAAREAGVDRLYPAVLGLSLDHGGAFVVPRLYGPFVEVNGGSTVFETMARLQDAKKAWAKSGPKDLALLKDEHRNFDILVKNAYAAKAGRLFFLDPDLYMETLIGTLILLPLFLVVDWIAVRTARPKRRWQRTALA